MDQTQPNVLLLIFDSLRPDFLSCYGGSAETPTIDSLAGKGTIFDQAYSVSSGTPVSHAAMFSGQYPSETGVVGQTDIPTDIPLIAEHLRNEGYETFGVPGPGRMGAEWGYDRGFSEYFESFTDDKPDYTSKKFLRDIITNPTLRDPLLRDFVRTVHKGPDSLTSFKFDLLAEQIERNFETPFFGMLNTTLVHNPYDPPRPYKKKCHT